MCKKLSAEERFALAERAAKKEDLPIDFLLTFDDDGLRAMADDFSPEELQQRMRDTDSSAYDDPFRLPKFAAFLEFLAKEPAGRLKELIANPTAVVDPLAAYIVTEDDLTPDTQEAAEAATGYMYYLADATAAWRRLNPREQFDLLTALGLDSREYENAARNMLDPC